MLNYLDRLHLAFLANQRRELAFEAGDLRLALEENHTALHWAQNVSYVCPYSHSLTVR